MPTRSNLAKLGLPLTPDRAAQGIGDARDGEPQLAGADTADLHMPLGLVRKGSTSLAMPLSVP
jgi:hypothetical protein